MRRSNYAFGRGRGRAVGRAVGIGIAFVLVATACSGGSDDLVSAEDSPLFDEEANAPIEQIDEASGGVATGPIEGLLTIQPSFGFGAYAVDGASGQASAIPGLAAAETVDRNSDVIVSGDAAYALGLKTRDGQSFSFDVSILKFDYETGEARQLAALGFDRETDDDSLISHQLVAVAGDSVIASSGEFGGGDKTYNVYDAQTGEQTGSFGEPSYSYEGEFGSCSGSVGELVGLSDGRLIATSLSSPAFVDLESGEVELAIPCDAEAPELVDFVSVADITDYAVFAEGPSPTDEDLERLLIFDLEPQQGFIEGGGDLWWVSVTNRSVNDVQAIVGGVVQFDLATQSVEAVHPLGVHLGRFDGCAEDRDECIVTTLSQAQMRYIDDRLVMVNNAENAPLLVLDPSTGEITATVIDLRGADFTDTDLLAGDRNAVWLQVRRMTVTSDDENGRTAVGESYFELVDATTGQITLSLLGEDLFS